MDRCLIKTGLFALLITLASTSQAQMVTTTTPYQNFSDSYYNFGGFNWGLSGPGWSLNIPMGNNFLAFGGADPNSGLRGDFGFGAGNTNGFLGFNFGQGSSRSGSVVAPSITTINGAPGSIFSGTQRPFVTSVTPVVSGFGGTPNDQIQRSGLARQNANLQDIAARKEGNRKGKAMLYWNRATRAAEAGNLKTARANYRLAYAKANGPLKLEIARQMLAHGWKP